VILTICWNATVKWYVTAATESEHNDHCVLNTHVVCFTVLMRPRVELPSYSLPSCIPRHLHNYNEGVEGCIYVPSCKHSVQHSKSQTQSIHFF